MADLDFTVDYNDLKLLTQELNKTKGAVKLTAASASKDFDSMRRSIDPVYNAVQTFQGKVLVAQKALLTKSISNKQYADTMEMIQRQAAMAGVQVNKFGEVVAMTGNKMNKFGSLGMQQFGYQVGDFLVQVQSGTNAFVAFGQQATQLVGIMGMLNPALIGLSAGLSIAIPIVTAIGAAWMRTNEATEKANDDIKQLDTTISNLRGSLSLLVEPIEDIKDKFGEFSDAAINSAKATLSAQVALAKSVLAEELSYSDTVFGKFSRATGMGGLLSKGVEDLRREFNLSVQEADNLQAEFDKIIDSSGTLEEKADALSSLQTAFENAGIGLDSLDTQLLRSMVEAGKLNEQLFILLKLMQDVENPPKRQSGSKSKSNLQRFQEQLKIQQEVINMTESEATVRKALGDEYKKVGAGVIATLEQQVAAIETERQKAEETKGLVESISSSFESGFMSIVDGTKSVKDAFKSMAGEIIKELYRVLVVKRMVNAVTTALGFADGGVFQGGSQIKAFANGGVVGGPTYFPMSGGKTGLMGEAGPEAIMPLKRGKNGKLGVEASGEGSPINVTNVFNLSANGDESVKKIIAQAAPQIAQMTQKQIMDSRRRGGQMKATFS